MECPRREMWSEIWSEVFSQKAHPSLMATANSILPLNNILPRQRDNFRGKASGRIAIARSHSQSRPRPHDARPTQQSSRWPNERARGVTYTFDAQPLGGGGAEGIVYFAISSATARRVAIKVGLKMSLQNNDEASQEARSHLRAHDHPNVADYIHFEPANVKDPPLLIMEANITTRERRLWHVWHMVATRLAHGPGHGCNTVVAWL